MRQDLKTLMITTKHPVLRARLQDGRVMFARVATARSVSKIDLDFVLAHVAKLTPEFVASSRAAMDGAKKPVLDGTTAVSTPSVPPLVTLVLSAVREEFSTPKETLLLTPHQPRGRGCDVVREAPEAVVRILTCVERFKNAIKKSEGEFRDNIGALKTFSAEMEPRVAKILEKRGDSLGLSFRESSAGEMVRYNLHLYKTCRKTRPTMTKLKNILSAVLVGRDGGLADPAAVCEELKRRFAQEFAEVETARVRLARSNKRARRPAGKTA